MDRTLTAEELQQVVNLRAALLAAPPKQARDAVQVASIVHAQGNCHGKTPHCGPGPLGEKCKGCCQYKM